jgi:hypothetical protein
MDIVELHSQALDAIRGVIAGVRQGQWPAPTPCPGWDVRALVNHVVSGNLWAAELAAGKTISEVGDHLDGDLLGVDPLGAYDASGKAAAAVFAVPRALEAPCSVSYGPVPGAVYAGHRFFDVLIHVPAACSVTTSSWRTPAMRIPACWSRWGDEREMSAATRRAGEHDTASAQIGNRYFNVVFSGFCESAVQNSNLSESAAPGSAEPAQR